MIDAPQRLLKSLPAWLLCLATAVIVFAPGLLDFEADQRATSFEPPAWYESRTDSSSTLLGTDYLGRPFLGVLCRSTSSTAWIALWGTAAVTVGALAVGVVHGSTRSAKVDAILSAGNLGVMAVPEAAVLITIATSWPRTAPAWHVNASMLAVLVVFSIPAGARLVAERVRAINRTGFVFASHACGATYAHVLRREIWPHLLDDLAWIVASILPRFVAIEVGLTYLGVEYREFEGLGRLLAKCFANMLDGVALSQMLITIAAVLWIALLPQAVFGLLGLRPVRGDVS